MTTQEQSALEKLEWNYGVLKGMHKESERENQQLRDGLRVCEEALAQLRGTAHHAHACYEMKLGQMNRKEKCCGHCEVKIILAVLAHPSKL